MLTSLEFAAQKPAKSALVWEPGITYGDAAAQVDVILGARHKWPEKMIHAVVLRAKDKDNHYRLEVERGKENAVRLVKRASGNETVIATAKEPPDLAPFDFKTNPASTAWHNLVEKEVQNGGFEKWRMDRIEFQAKGNELQAWVNGRQVFPEAVKDEDLKQGAPGLYAENLTYFDNVEIGPPR
jgi:hypothetical protein